MSVLPRNLRLIVHTDGVETREAAGAMGSANQRLTGSLTAEQGEATEFTRHRVRLLLPALLLVNLAYPLSEVHPATALVYAFTYVALLALGARVAAVTRARQISSTAFAGAIALLSVPWVLFPDALWLSLGVYALLVGFHLLVIVAVAQHLVAVTGRRDVLYAGTSLYVLVGDVFVPAAMIVQLITVELTGAAAYGAEAVVGWQQMAYISFTTLTTLGRDVLHPVTATAQVLAVAEATIGVLVVAVIVARLIAAELAPGTLRRHDA